MTTAMKTRTKVGALAAAAVTAGLPALAFAPTASAASYYLQNGQPNTRYCSAGTVVKSKVKRLTSGGDEITLQVKQNNYGCVSVRVTMPPYFSAANSGAQLRRPPQTDRYGNTTNDLRWRVQGFYGEGGSAKTLSDGRNYYETGYFSTTDPAVNQFVQFTNWGTMTIGISRW